jgi:spermidine/putrescine transport system substrate-binding protein
MRNRDTCDRDALDRAIIRALRGRHLSRRDLFRYAGLGAGAALLAACNVGGENGNGNGNGTGPTASASPRASLPPKTGTLVMANWPAYIDKSYGRSQTLIDFREQFDVDMTYEEAINDNDEFFGTDLREPLSQNQPTGWDIVVLSDWLIAKMIRLGYVEPLFPEALPNFAGNASGKFKDPWYDPGNVHSLPWAAGITGIGYNRALTGRDLTSIDDLFDPAFAGRVGMFLEMRDTYNFMLLKAGKDPETATLDDIEAATQELIEHRDRGQFRAFYGNDYLDQLGGGNLAATMAWSGDVFALSVDDPNLRFVLPEEGGTRWTDNMCIPRGSEHIHDAHLFMDYVYDPEVATRITEWVWYESPVAQVQQMISDDAEESDDDVLRDLATDPYVFPTTEVTENTHPYRNLDADEEAAWLDLFQQVVTG